VNLGPCLYGGVMADDLYFIRWEGGPVKIGRALDPKRRLAHFQVGCPYDLILVGTVPNGGEWEWRIHSKLQSERMRGEWFAWTPRTERIVRYALDPVTWKTKLKLPEPKEDEDWRVGSPLYAGDPNYPQFQLAEGGQ
jgi:hypothetical protein